MASRQDGFTLVEIAIVLIIVGLMLGGVMKGQDLIDNARVKSLTSDFRNVPLYLYAYQDKFRAVPGDDAAVDAHLGARLCQRSCRATGSGQVQGNGVVEGAWNSTNRGDESFRFWQHVRLAGLAAGPTDVNAPDYLPRNAIGGPLGITAGSTSPIGTLRGAQVVCSRGIPGRFARQIDIALDDGDTATGSIQAMADTATSAAGGVDAVDNDLPYTLCMGF
ncbi:MAG TPA: prepilin-type N-terminal cleavage/methylation domain-containing protein [Rhodocyclaceae bacterium]